MKAAVFLERDGVINEARMTDGRQMSPLHMDEFTIRRDVRPSLLRLKEAGFLVIITTHQSGLANGRLCRSELDLMHTMLYRALPIDDLLMCPHAEGDDCHCQRPEPGLFTEAAFKWHLDMDLSFVISNKGEDAQAAHCAGCTSVLIESPLNGGGHHDFVVQDLQRAVDKITKLYVPAKAAA